MKFTDTSYTSCKTILANDDWAGVPHKFSADAKAGDIVDGVGVCLYDVTAANNPNGTVVYRGVIDVRKIEESQKPTTTQVSALPLIKWLNADGTFFSGTGSG